MVAARIKRYLDEHGIKQSYLADAVGIHPVILSAIFTGKRRLLADEYLLICKALGVSCDLFTSSKDAA